MWCALDNYFSKEKWYLIIVNRLEWLREPSDPFFVYMFLWTWWCTTSINFPIILILLTNKNVALIYSVICCEQKAKDYAHGQGASNINCIVVFYLWCLPPLIISVLANDDLINRVTYQIQRYISVIIWNTPQLTEFENRCFESPLKILKKKNREWTCNNIDNDVSIKIVQPV